MPTIMILIRLVIITITGRVTRPTEKQCSKSRDSFQNNDPRSRTPLVSPVELAQAFRDNKGLGLNFHGTDHSFTHGVNSPINVGGCLDPQLGQLGTNGDAYRCWQQRMRSQSVAVTTL